MTQEEKAKRYDKLFVKASRIYNKENDVLIIHTIEDLFPELKESGDERIRKAIIKHLISINNGCYKKPSEDIIDNWIAWLEKQGEQSSAMEAANEEKLDNQNCVKSADKVEPKFKVGDWLYENEPNNYDRFIQILEIVNVQGKDRYRISRNIHKDEDVVEFGFVEKYYHKFDIRDAKDGDVLSQDLMGGKTFIYNGVNPDMAILYSFIISNDGEDVLPYHIGKPNTGIGNIEENKNIIHPATKEQRDLLFQKMKEAGYEWDAEKKELKKIEQISSDEIGNYDHEKVLESIMSAEIKTPEESLGIDSDTYSKIVDECVYGKQNSAWSEEQREKRIFI